MSDRGTFVAFGFESTHNALAAEALLKDADVPVVPVPTPADMGSLCGIALRVSPGDADHAERLIKASGIRPSGRIVFEDWA